MAPELQFDLDTRHRASDVRWASVLTSRWIVFILLISLVCAAAGWTTLYLSETLGVIDVHLAWLLGVSLATTGLAGFWLLLFAFGATHYPYHPPPFTVSQLLEHGGNAADAATFAALQRLTPHANRPTLEHLPEFFEELLKSAEVANLLARLELSPVTLWQLIINSILPELTWSQLAEGALKVAASMNEAYLHPLHFLAVAVLHPALKNDLRKLEYTEKDLAFALWWQIALAEQHRRKARWWSKEQLLDFTGIGLSWASGYTPFVDQFSRVPPGNAWDVPLGHEEQVEALINALARARQSNVLLVGQPGSGRLGVIKEVARRVEGSRAHEALRGDRLMYIHVGQLLGIAGSGPEQLATISQALTEMERAGNVIAIIDGIGSILGGGEGSATNLTDVIMPFFSSNKVRVVVIMSNDEYHARFRNNADLMELFEVVQVDPLTPEQTLQLLALTAEVWERRTGVFLLYKTLRAIVRSTATIMPEIPFPEKAFDVLEEALVVMQEGRGQTLSETQVNDIISRKIGFNIGKLAASEKSHLLNLEDFIHARVVNQEKGVAAVARAMIRARAGVSSGKRPIGTFLFLGPTGVGKTETAKALAEAYFGSEDYMQRLDMSEYQGPDAIGRLIGTPRNPTGALTSVIADHPFTVLLLDEFEKADRQVHLLFLQVFDEGHITDVRRRRFSFNHAIIVATSNAGAEFIRENISPEGKLPEKFDDTLREHILKQDLFRPELVNRFDGVITFTPLSKEHIQKVATLMLRKLNKQLDEQHGLTVKVTPDLINFLVSIGYNPEFGARPMQRAIQNTVEYAVAQKILRGEAEPGQELVLHSSELSKIQIPG